MDLRVTVETALTEKKLRGHRARKATGVEGDAGVSALRVTALAEQRCPLREHGRLIGAVRCVAEPAILRRRRVLPDMRSASFGVALLAGIDGGEL